MLSLTAEDLLRSTTVPELRDLCVRLEKEANAKQKDLQTMVGSRYRDFIQSTDAIEFMHDKANITNHTISNFWKHGQELVSNTQQLYATAIHLETSSSYETANNNTNSTPILSCNTSIDVSRVSSAMIWTCLSDCNVYDASMLCIVGHILLNQKTSSKNVNFHLDSFKYFTNNFHTHLDTYFNPENKNSIDMQKLYEMKSAVSLKQTIIDDAHLILQAHLINSEFTLSSNEKAKSLVVISFLSDIPDAELMKLYLNYFSQALQQLKLSVEFMKESSTDISFTTTSSILNETVRLLQSAILDAHILFFRDVSHVFPGESITSHGLIALSKSVIIQEVTRALVNNNNNAGSNNISGALSAEQLFNHFDFHSFFQKNSMQHLNDLKKMFGEWLHSTMPDIHYICSSILEMMESASEVARLQQVVWYRSCHAGEQNQEDFHSYDGIEDYEKWKQKYWEEASKEFLTGMKKKRPMHVNSGSNSDEHIKGGTLLWDTVFRIPFMKQMERLLEEACQDMLQQIKAKVFMTLAAEGLTIDPLSLAVTHVDPCSETTAGENVSSVRIFTLAEAIRRLFERQVYQLLRDVTMPTTTPTPTRASSVSSDNGSNQDTQSNHALLRSLYTHSSQLLGHVIVFLRHISLSCQASLQHGLGVGVGGAVVSTQSMPLLISSLIVGRIAWLFKINGRFLEEIFIVSLNNHHTGLATREYISEDQLFSAFEIADTNGDGVVTLAEAVEALQALSLDSAEMEAASGNFSFLKHVPSATLTFFEFAQLSANILPTPTSSHVPVDRLVHSLDTVIAAAHTAWTKGIVDLFAVGFKELLVKELGVEELTSVLNSTPSFKNTWREKQVFLDDEATGDDRYSEIISYPSAISMCLTGLFYRGVSALNGSIVSADTLYHIPDDTLLIDRVEPTFASRRAPKILALTNYVGSLLFSAIGVAVLSAYDTVQLESNRTNERLSPQAAAKYKDYTVQAVFDILVSESLLKRFTNLPTVAYADVSHDWKERLDPVDEALMAPLLAESMQEYILRSKFLLPGADIASKAVKTAAIPTTSASTVKDDSAVSKAADGVFNTVAPRFSLLPLALSTSTVSSKGQRQGTKRDDRAASSTITSKDAEKNTFGMLTSNLGELGMNFGNSLGNLLGAAANDLVNKQHK